MMPHAAGTRLVSTIVVAFDPQADLGRDRAFRLMMNTPVTLYWNRQVLAETTAWLSANGYQIIRLNAMAWSTEHDFHSDIAGALDFPGYYGHNLDALNDCMRDVVSQDYGWAPATTGLVLVFTGYDAFNARFPRAA